MRGLPPSRLSRKPESGASAEARILPKNLNQPALEIIRQSRAEATLPPTPLAIIRIFNFGWFEFRLQKIEKGPSSALFPA